MKGGEAGQEERQFGFSDKQQAACRQWRNQLFRYAAIARTLRQLKSKELQHSYPLLQYQNTLYLCLSFSASTELAGNFSKAKLLSKTGCGIPHPAGTICLVSCWLEQGSKRTTRLSTLTKLPVFPINTISPLFCSVLYALLLLAISQPWLKRLFPHKTL